MTPLLAFYDLIMFIHNFIVEFGFTKFTETADSKPLRFFNLRLNIFCLYLICDETERLYPYKEGNSTFCIYIF